MEMGKPELCTSCVISIADILSQRLVVQYHDNDTLPDLANVLPKQFWQVLSQHDIETITPVSLSITCWKFILKELIDKHIRKPIWELRNII